MCLRSVAYNCNGAVNPANFHEFSMALLYINLLRAQKKEKKKVLIIICRQVSSNMKNLFSFIYNSIVITVFMRTARRGIVHTFWNANRGGGGCLRLTTNDAPNRRYTARSVMSFQGAGWWLWRERIALGWVKGVTALLPVPACLSRLRTFVDRPTGDARWR